MRSVIVFSIVSMIGIGFGGCAKNELDTRRLATTAALSNYPGNAREYPDMKMAAVDDEGGKSLRIINFSDAPTPVSTIWVNGRYMKQVAPIGARSSIVIPYGELLEGGSGVLDLGREPQEQVQRVEIQTNEGLFSVLGPAKV